MKKPKISGGATLFRLGCIGLAAGILFPSCFRTERLCPSAKAADKPAAVKEPETLVRPTIRAARKKARVIHLQDLRSQILDKLSLTNDLDNASVYVEDLNSWVWTGINERQPYLIASLAKVGMAIAWLKWDEEQPGIIEKKIIVKPEHVEANDPFSSKTEEPVTPGEYRIIHLIERMIISSDNTALVTLSKNIPAVWVNETFEDIGLPNPFDSDQDGKVSPKQYAQMIKSLYNASYLEPGRAGMLLKMMGRSRFSAGLRSVLPKGVLASLKYGFWQSRSIFECGIVYLKDNPYLVCIFAASRDGDPVHNLTLIRTIGFTVHAFFEDMLK